MPTLTVFANNPSTTVATNGYNGSASHAGTPSSGTVETWTMTGSSEFVLASNSSVPATEFHIANPALPNEVIRVTNCSGTGNNTWTVVRGDESTATADHAAGATFYQVVSADDLLGFKQASSSAVSPVTIANSSVETVVASYQPVTGEIVPGTSFEAIAFGTYTTGGNAAARVMTWRLRWGGVTGTVLATLISGTNAPVSAVTTVATGSSFDVNGTVSFIDATHATANLNWWYDNAASLATTASNAVTSAATSGSAAASIVVSGSGPLVLTYQWGAVASYLSMTSIAPLIYRAA